MEGRTIDLTEDEIVCPNCGRAVPRPAFSRWPPDNALATAVCRGCGRNITVTLRLLQNPPAVV